MKSYPKRREPQQKTKREPLAPTPTRQQASGLRKYPKEIVPATHAQIPQPQTPLLAPSVPHTLPAATLLETLVSFALISIIFVIGALIWLQLAGNAAPYRQADYRLDCRNILHQTEAQADLTDQVFTLHNTQYHRKITPLNPNRGLYEVNIAVYAPDGKFLMRRHKTIHVHAR